MPDRSRNLDDYSDHELLDVVETAEVLKCSKDTVYEMARRGELPRPVKRGRKIAFSAFALRRWITEQSGVEPAPPKALECPVCGTKFYPTMPNQLYDRPYCKLKAFRLRQRQEKEK